MQASHIVVALLIGGALVFVGFSGKPGSLIAAVIDPQGLGGVFGGGAAGSFA